MKIKVRKLFRGHASVRNYLVEKAIKNKEDLTIQVNGVTKTFPYISLKTYLTNSNNEIHKSKYKRGQEYRLIDFPWGKADW